MDYFILFLEGVITFVSPCLLPMIPVYLIYFAGGDKDKNTKKILINASGFICGFTILFTALGALSSALGGLFTRYKTEVNIITGAAVVLFGLNYIGIFKIGFLNRTAKRESSIKPSGFFSALLFGIIFAAGWTPCVGAFLGSALLMASGRGSILKGIIMLLIYSLGLGIPFLLSALLIGRLTALFGFIKRHYNIVNIICGSLLVITGILMMTGLFYRLI